ncbi:putative DNA photolyase, rossmann-like alpha/beta/alpha sandwich [Helianthus anomalus]
MGMSLGQNWDFGVVLEGHYYPGRVSRWWLKQSLSLLDSSLQNLGTSLSQKKSTHSVLSLLDVVKSTGATHLFFNHLYGGWQLGGFGGF